MRRNTGLFVASFVLWFLMGVATAPALFPPKPVPDPISDNSLPCYYRVDVKDTRHLDFSDMVFWGGPLRERSVMGAIEPACAVDATRAIVRQYFDQELLGQRSPMLSGSAPFPEVTVQTVAPIAR